MKLKRTIIFIVAILLIVTTVGCGKKEKVKEIKKESNKTSSIRDLSIDDFVIKTEQSKCYGYDCFVFNIVNNSKYEVIGVELTYGIKQNVKDKDLEIFNDFINEHSDYFEEEVSLRNVILRGNKNQLIAKGEELSGVKLSLGYDNWFWYESPTEEQFNLMEPKELQVGIIKDKKLCIAYYDYNSNTWKLDTQENDVDIWSNTDPAKKIKTPSSKHNVILTNNDEKFSFYAYGVTKNDYLEYVEYIKSNGFEEEDSTSSTYTGISNDGFSLDLEYEQSSLRLYVSISVLDE